MVAETSRNSLKIVVVGHVDHGKSTIVGRLIHATGALPEAKFAAIQAMSAKRGMPFEWAFLMDALQAERDQGITIDTTQIHFKTDARDYVLIDAPGHKEFLKNMVTGAASADAAILVVDGHDGIQEQTRRHAYLLHILGIRRVVALVNKMDLVDYAERRFVEVRQELLAYLGAIGLAAADVAVVPVSGRNGDLIAAPSPKMGWYTGPTLLAALDAIPQPVAELDLPLRLPIQDVYKLDARRIIAGRIEAGRLHVGDTLLFSPSSKTARVASIESWNTSGAEITAGAGKSIGITLDEQIFVERGQVASHLETAPILSNVFRARIFWLGHQPLRSGARYRLKFMTNDVEARVEKIERVIDTADLSSKPTEAVERNAVAEIVLRARAVLALDEFTTSPRTGRFVLVEDYTIVGGGIISMEGYPDQRVRGSVKSTNLTPVEDRVLLADRWRFNGHRSGIMWFTGYSGSGKSTMAMELERILFSKGFQVAVLDGDNIRHGLNADLGFSPEDRVQNIRRVGEVAALMARSGTIVITAFISPYLADRERVRAAHRELFHEIHIATPLEVCEARDVKGLYRKARAGEIADFTGVSAPYEPPPSPELVIDGSKETIADSLARLVAYVERVFAIDEQTLEPPYSI
ncbi:MAG: adenylyl-sulfate kinase [Rhodospirillales bacterium]|nr:adenylyl-sulfate kinase [Rhodospirillales bacterium]